MKDGYILPVASINSGFVDDQKISDIFRLSLLKESILEHKNALGIMDIDSNISLLKQFNQCLISTIPSVNQTAQEIASLYGRRLAKILSMFFNPSSLSRQNRTNWTEAHWSYWRTIERVYLVGGITSPILTKLFYKEIIKAFKSQGIDKQVEFITGSQNLGTKGLSTLVDNDTALLFDFGQTNIKRAYYSNMNDSTIDIVLPTVKSKYLFYKYQTNDELKVLAETLHQYIIDVIVDTANEVDFTGTTIKMAIANYIYKGQINISRGGYGKLALVAKQYDAQLSKDISHKLKRKIKVELFHDTTAMGLNFRNQKNTAVISIGTAFGIAFPNQLSYSRLKPFEKRNV